MTGSGSSWKSPLRGLYKGLPGTDRVDPGVILLSVLALLAGVFFRLYQLYGQILVDDEWHAVHKVLVFDYWNIFTDFGMADHCIPLSLFYEFLLNNLWISELLVRLPSLAAGILALVIIPLLLYRLAGVKTALVTACLLSISPLHVFYSRLARPYAIAMLLSFIAVMAFYFWWTEKGRAWIAVYTGAGVLSVWFLLPSAPFVGAPFVFAFLHGILSRKAAEAFRRLLAPGICFTAGILALLLPPFLAKPEAILEKAGRDSITPQSLWGSIELFAGTSRLWIMVLVILLALTGLGLLLRKNRMFALYSLLLVVMQLLGFFAAGPVGSSWSILLNRYTIAVLPFIMLWAAVCLTSCLPGNKYGFLSNYSFVPLLLILLVGGPFREIYFSPNNLTNYAAYQISYRYEVIREMIKPDVIPAFYDKLAEKEPGSLTLLEAPWQYHDNIYGYYQWFHKQHMLIGFVQDPDWEFLPGEVPVRDKRFRFRNSLHVSDRERIEDRGVDYVIFHRQLRKERASDLPFYEAEIAPWIKMYGELYGKPDYEDEYLTVFRVTSKDKDNDGE